MIEEDVLLALTVEAPAPTRAENRVYAVVLPQDIGFPAISYQRISDAPVNDYSGHSGLDRVRIQIDAWAQTYWEAKALGEEIRACMLAADFKAVPDTDFDDFETESKLYRFSADFFLWQGL